MHSYPISGSEMDVLQQLFSALKTGFAKENQERVPGCGGVRLEGK